MGVHRTIKVLLHIARDNNSWAAGVISSEWAGATRLDRRLSSSRPLPAVEYFPPGSDRDVYRAWLALGDLLSQQSGGRLLEE